MSFQRHFIVLDVVILFSGCSSFENYKKW